MGFITLKSNVFVSRMPDGVILRGIDGPVVFKGRRAHDILHALLKAMDHRLTFGQIVEQFPDAMRPIITGLMDELRSRHLLRDRDEDDPSPDVEQDVNLRNLWNYLADHLPRPGAALLRWQSATCYVAGSAESSLYLVRALAECAARNVMLVDSSITLEQSLVLSQIEGEFPELSVKSQDWVTGESFAPACGGPDSIWFYAIGDNEFSSENCSVSDAWYFGLLSGHLAISLVRGQISSVLPVWRDRVRPALSDGQIGRLSDERISLGAAATAFMALKWHTGIVPAPDGPIVHIVESTAQITSVKVPDPQVIRRMEVSATKDNPKSEVMDLDAKLNATKELFNPVSGILDDDLEIDLTQVPLSVVPLRVYSHDRTLPPTHVLGWGNTVTEARLRAIQRAVRAHIYTVPEISQIAASVSVEWSASESAANALAMASIRSCRDNNRYGQKMSSASLTAPEVYKLFKILSLLSGSQPTIVVKQSMNPASVNVQVQLNGEIVSEVTSSRLDAAAYEALGDACLIAQLPELRQALPAPVAHYPPEPLLSQCLEIDLGYPSLRNHLHCSIISTRESIC